MKIPNLPFHNVLGDLLYALFFQGECITYTSLLVTSDEAIALGTAPQARYALIVVEADPDQQNRDLVLRFREDGNAPTYYDGMPLGDMGVYEIKGTENMERFQVIGIEPGKQHRIRVQFFG